MSLKWRQLCNDKRERQSAAIPKKWLLPNPPPSTQTNVINIPNTCGLLSSRELDITDLDDVDALLAKLASAEWTALEVTTAYYKRAVIAHQLTNCLTEIFVDKALDRARWLDAYLAREGRTAGPLHGLPVSLKDQFRIKGLETVMGYASWVGIIAEKDAVLVEMLTELGAISFVRTNVPQTLMWGETYNLVFGRTTNPHNRLLSPGGSSGGEGALVAMRGSPVGVGTDIGGSIRIPSAWNGLYGLRPSYNRLPYQGAANTLEGQETIPSVLGPMARSLASVKTFTKAIIDAKPWEKDPMVVRKPWDQSAYALSDHGGGKHLCFGIVYDDGLVEPHPPIIRALKITKDALERAGHTVILWEPFKSAEIRENLNLIFIADGGEDFSSTCRASDEPLLTTMSPDTTQQSEMPEDEPLTNAIFRDNDPLTVHQLFQAHAQKRQLLKEHLDHWNATKSRTGTGRPVDAIIAPVMATLAPPHGKNVYDFYCEIWNVVDSASVAFPVTVADPALDPKQPPHTFRAVEDEIVYDLYEPEIFRGAPVGLQIVGRKLEEEAVIAMAEIVDAALGAR